MTGPTGTTVGDQTTAWDPIPQGLIGATETRRGHIRKMD